MNACRLVISLWGVGHLLEQVEQLEKKAIRQACYAIGDSELEAEQLLPCAALLARFSLASASALCGRTDSEAPVRDMIAAASALGATAGILEAVATDGGPELANSVLHALLELLDRGADPQRRNIGLLRYSAWALAEAAQNSRDARSWLAKRTSGLSLVDLAGSLLEQAKDPDSETSLALRELFRFVALTQGSGPVLAAMDQWPQWSSILAAGSEALRVLLQGGHAIPSREAVAAVLRRACARCPGVAEVETPAQHAIGLLMGPAAC